MQCGRARHELFAGVAAVNNGDEPHPPPISQLCWLVPSLTKRAEGQWPLRSAAIRNSPKRPDSDVSFLDIPGFMRHIIAYFVASLRIVGGWHTYLVQWRLGMPGSDKRANFVRLAEGRTQVALDAIRKLGNLSNRRAYEFTDADIRKISKVLKEAVSDLERRFGSSNDVQDSFRL